jgi:ribonuclease T1
MKIDANLLIAPPTWTPPASPRRAGASAPSIAFAVLALLLAIVLGACTGTVGEAPASGISASPRVSDGLLFGPGGFASDPPSDWIDGTVGLAGLPPEALETLELIATGGPFPYDQDGSTFHNREGLLPPRRGGYYAEFTVETPGSPDRGARRLVVGDAIEVYYTDDHYASFRFVVP